MNIIHMSNEDAENDQPNSSSGTGTTTGTGTGTPTPCPTGLGWLTATVNGSTTINHPFDTDAAIRAYANMIGALIRTFLPTMCRVTQCNPPCTCIPIPVSLPTYWITTTPPGPGTILPTFTLNVKQDFKSYCL